MGFFRQSTDATAAKTETDSLLGTTTSTTSKTEIAFGSFDDHDSSILNSTVCSDEEEDDQDEEHEEEDDHPSSNSRTVTRMIGPIGESILKLAIPAAGALLIDPFMTLADTAFVGHFTNGGDDNSNNSGDAGRDALAGMGSAAAILTFCFYLFDFFCTATTPLVACQRAAGNQHQAVQVAGQALSLALTLGCFLTTLLLTLREPLLTLMMGTDLTGRRAAHDHALAFLSVRAFAAPAVLVMNASTGILRGYLDTQTPIVVLLLANVVNLILDVILVVMCQWGPLGAAIATTCAEWISATLFLAILAGYLPRRRTILLSDDDDKLGETVISIVPLMELPTWQQVQPLVVASSSAFFRALVLQLALLSAFAMAAQNSQKDAATAAVAAHQIGFQLYILCSFVFDSLAAASQALIADALGRHAPQHARQVCLTVFGYSSVLGIALALLLQIGFQTQWLFDLFTNDVATRRALASIMPLIIIGQPLNALVFTSDGILQGAAEFPFQARAMLLAAFLAYMTFDLLDHDHDDDTTTDPSQEEQQSSTSSLVHVWVALLVLQLVRCLTSLYKLVHPKGPIQLLHTTVTV